MKRKGWIRILSIAVALLLPVSALAQSAAADLLTQAKADGKEIVSTVTFEPGAALAKDQVLADMCAATALRLQYLPGGYSALVASLSGTDVFSAQFRVEDTGIYVMSEALGDKPLYTTWDDLKNGLVQLLKTSGMSDEMLGSFTEGLEQGLATGTLAAGIDETTMTKEEIKQKVIEAMGGGEDMLAWVNGIEAKKVVTTGSFTLDDSDTADTKTELTLTKDDILALYQTQFVKDMIVKQLKAADSTLTDADAAAKADEAIAELVKAVEKSAFEVKVLELTNGEDDFVATQVDLTATVVPDQMNIDTAVTDAAATETTETAAAPTAAPDKPVEIAATMKALKKTSDTGVMYTLSIGATSDGASVLNINANLNKGDKTVAGSLNVAGADAKPVLELAMACDMSDPKNVSGTLQGTAYDGSDQYAFVLAAGQAVADASVDTTVSLSTGNSLDAIAADPATALLGTLKINTVVQADSGYFKSLASATPATSVEYLKLNEDDMATYLKALETGYAGVMYNIFANLPKSAADALAQSQTVNAQ